MDAVSSILETGGRKPNVFTVCQTLFSALPHVNSFKLPNTL